MKNVTINGRSYSQVFGGTLPGPIWRDAMEKALIGTEPMRFDIKNKYGLTTKDPYVYVPPPPSNDDDKPDKGDKPKADDSAADPATPAPSATPAPQPSDPGTFDNTTP
jgi:membrane peptidoglycan carboxypeptidase